MDRLGHRSEGLGLVLIIWSKCLILGSRYYNFIVIKLRVTRIVSLCTGRCWWRELMDHKWAHVQKAKKKRPKSEPKRALQNANEATTKEMIVHWLSRVRVTIDLTLSWPSLSWLDWFFNHCVSDLLDNLAYGDHMAHSFGMYTLPAEATSLGDPNGHGSRWIWVHFGPTNCGPKSGLAAPVSFCFHGCAYPNLQNTPYYGMRIRRSLGEEKGKILDFFGFSN